MFLFKRCSLETSPARAVPASVISHISHAVNWVLEGAGIAR